MRKIGIFFALMWLFLCGGCQIVGFIAAPSAHEKKIPAEFALRDLAEDRILVLVDRAQGSRTDIGLEDQLGGTVGLFLTERVGIKKKYVAFDGQRDFRGASPAKMGAAAGAGVVLYIVIEDYRLYDMAGRGYYNGTLVTRSVLVDTDSGKVLWPASDEGRVVRIKIELEIGGRQAAVGRLVTATAHCIGRVFYNCPKDEFRIRDEETEYDTRRW